MSDEKKLSTKSNKQTKQPDSQLENLQSQLADLDSKYKRSLADYHNLVKQHQKDRSEYLQYANSQLITSLLPLLDNLQMAHQHLQDPGLDMIVTQFQQILTDEGLESINPSEGDHFDPHLHEALDTVETVDENKIGHIAETSLTGYKYQDGQVLRHAKVKVYKTKASNT